MLIEKDDILDKQTEDYFEEDEKDLWFRKSLIKDNF